MMKPCAYPVQRRRQEEGEKPIAQTFNCPNCNAPLAQPAPGVTSVVCSFCNTPVIVPQEMCAPVVVIREEEEDRDEATVETSPQLRAVLKGHKDVVSAVAWSPDGMRLASTSEMTVLIWDAVEGKLLTTLSGHTENTEAVAWSPDGRQVASGSEDKTIRLWDVSSV